MKEFITEKIVQFVLEENKKLHIFREPLVGFARADSEYMMQIDDIAVEGHAKPKDLMGNAKTVISYFIPFTYEFNEENKVEGLASESWARGYEETNAMMAKLNAYIIEEIEKSGYEAVLPSDEALAFDREKLISHWSQRHMGYAAGLGTFGLNNMLITKKGCSGRLGSVIASFGCDWDVPMTEEQCLNKQTGVCRVCQLNCMAKALSDDEFDRSACYEVCMANAEVYKDFGDSYGGGVGSEVCGKCISFSPCAYRK